MKQKLKKFTEFSKSILPHEANYLKSVIQFTDPEKLKIINLLITNATSKNQCKPFDANINKRKYSYIKSWIEKKLDAINVDLSTAWLMALKQKVLTDAITSDDEKMLLQHILSYKAIDYNFQNLYDLAKEYKSYLLVRMRYNDHEIVANFLSNYLAHYKKALAIHEKLYNATTEITNQYTLNNNETRHLESWLYSIFKDDALDGKNRYKAFVLLAFMYTNYNENDKLRHLFNTIDVYFGEGKMYSKRLLCNYYANRVLLHSKQNQFNTAEYYGYLSLRHNNNDTLMYVNNLTAILLKNKQTKQAYQLLESYKNLYQSVHNYHQKIGFCSYLIRVNAELGKTELAEATAKLFLKKHKDHVLKHRWHHFFTSYISVLISQEKYQEILKLSTKFNLIEKEKTHQKKLNYIPNISWSISLSKYMEGKINSAQLLKELKTPLIGNIPNNNQKQLMLQIINKLSNNHAEVFHKIKSHIQ